MRIRGLGFVVVLSLIGSGVLFVRPAGGERGRIYNGGQLRYLFSDTKAEVIGDCLDDIEGGSGFGRGAFEFKADGTLSGKFTCETEDHLTTQTDTGTWRIDGDTICMEADNRIFARLLQTDDKCWRVSEGRFGETSFDSANMKLWEFRIAHPAHGARPELLAALDALPAGGAETAAVAPPAAAAPAPKVPPTPVTELEPGQVYSGAQLTHMFSGVEARIEGICEDSEGPMTGVGSIEFAADGTFEGNIVCEDPEDVFPFSGSGTWRVENDTLCMKDEASDFIAVLPTDDGCWKVKHEAFAEVAYDSNNRRLWSYQISHPKYGSRRELLAALGGLPSVPVEVAAAPPAARPAPSAEAVAAKAAARKAAEAAARKAVAEAAAAQTAAAEKAARMAEDLAAWRTVENSTRIEDVQGYLNAYPQGQFANLATVKIQQLAALSAARQQQELAYWNRVQNSAEPGDFQGYIAAYPNGLFADTAKARIAALAVAKARAKADKARNEADSERTLWASVKDSRRAADLEGYLRRFPQGQYVAEANAKIKVIRKLASVADVDFGIYHALVIGIDDYQHLPKLKTALRDARAIADVLKREYGFRVTLLENPSRGDIIESFDVLRETLGYKDNLLVYYAGHGWLDEEADRGYWLPKDAKPNRRTQWVSNSTLTDTLRALQAKHVMVVADSCFSGTLVRGANIGLKGGDYWRRMAEKPARVAITSGGLEPVADQSGDGRHSPFAKAFIDALIGNDAVIDGTTLFGRLRRPVMVAAEQTPEYSDVRNAGHEGGDFLFVRRF